MSVTKLSLKSPLFICLIIHEFHIHEKISVTYRHLKSETSFVIHCHITISPYLIIGQSHKYRNLQYALSPVTKSPHHHITSGQCEHTAHHSLQYDVLPITHHSLQYNVLPTTHHSLQYDVLPIACFISGSCRCRSLDMMTYSIELTARTSALNDWQLLIRCRITLCIQTCTISSPAGSIKIIRTLFIDILSNLDLITHIFIC